MPHFPDTLPFTQTTGSLVSVRWPSSWLGNIDNMGGNASVMSLPHPQTKMHSRSAPRQGQEGHDSSCLLGLLRALPWPWLPVVQSQRAPFELQVRTLAASPPHGVPSACAGAHLPAESADTVRCLLFQALAGARAAVVTEMWSLASQGFQANWGSQMGFRSRPPWFSGSLG